jgi:hypothetical protein
MAKRFFVPIPHDIEGFFRSGMMRPTHVYDSSGSLRGEISIDGVLLQGETKALSLFESAKVDAVRQGKPLPKSGWKYWHIKRSNGLTSLFTYRRDLSDRLNQLIFETVGIKP